MTRSLAFRSFLAIATVAVGAALPGRAAAQAGLPSPEAVLARYVEAVGGKAAFDAVQGSRTLGRFEMPAAGIRGDLEVLGRRPNLSVSIVTLPGIGTIRTGFDGTTAWTVNPMTGPRVMEGAELQQTIDQSEFEGAIRHPRLFQSMETVGTVDVNGNRCVELRLVLHSGRELRECFSTETGLLVRSVTSMENPMGRMETTTYVEEYGSFDGLRSPTRIRQQMMGQEQVVIVTSVSYETIPLEEFAPPADIRAILGSGS
jgi:hypothetical protein